MREQRRFADCGSIPVGGQDPARAGDGRSACGSVQEVVGDVLRSSLPPWSPFAVRRSPFAVRSSPLPPPSRSRSSPPSRSPSASAVAFAFVSAVAFAVRLRRRVRVRLRRRVRRPPPPSRSPSASAVAFAFVSAVAFAVRLRRRVRRPPLASAVASVRRPPPPLLTRFRFRPPTASPPRAMVPYALAVALAFVSAVAIVFAFAGPRRTRLEQGSALALADTLADALGRHPAPPPSRPGSSRPTPLVVGSRPELRA